MTVVVSLVGTIEVVGVTVVASLVDTMLNKNSLAVKKVQGQ